MYSYDRRRTADFHVRGELLTKGWLMGVRRGWLSLLNPEIKGWDDVFRAFDRLLKFVDDLQEQVRYVRRAPTYSYVDVDNRHRKLVAAFKKLRDTLSDLRGSARHWYGVATGTSLIPGGSFRQEEGEHMLNLYRTKFHDLLDVHVRTKRQPSKGQYNTTRPGHVTELMDDVLALLREDAADLDRSRKLDPEGTEEAWGQSSFKEFSVGGMKVVITDPKFRGGLIDSYVKVVIRARRALEQKGFGKVWYGNLFIESASPKELSKEEQAAYAERGYDIQRAYGFYHASPDTIRIHESPGEGLLHTIVHELGHRHWFKGMTGTQRSRFESLVRVYRQSDFPVVDQRKAEVLRESIKRYYDLGFKLLYGFERAYRRALDNRERTAVVNEYASLFRDFAFKDKDVANIYGKMDAIFPHTWNWYPGPGKTSPQYETARKLWEKYTGTDQSAEVQLRRHMVNFRTLVAEDPEKWWARATEYLEDLKYVVWDFIRQAEALSQRTLDPDTSKVLPVSEYGKSHVDEAFAEVFAAYVLGQDMTRDQLESFRSVVGGQRILLFDAMD